jgi:hypothetical protein
MSDNMRYIVQTEDGQEIATLVALGPVKAIYDRAEGAVWIAQVDTIGRRLHKGRRTRVGLDPLANLSPLTLVVETLEGEAIEYRAVPVQGKPDPSEIVMPEEGE